MQDIWLSFRMLLYNRNARDNPSDLSYFLPLNNGLSCFFVDVGRIGMARHAWTDSPRNWNGSFEEDDFRGPIEGINDLEPLALDFECKSVICETCLYTSLLHTELMLSKVECQPLRFIETYESQKVSQFQSQITLLRLAAWLICF